MAKRGFWILFALAVVGGGVAGVVWATWPEPPPPTDWSQEYDTSSRPSAPASTALPFAEFPATYNLASRAADLIPPGTIVESTPPQGWSHLVIKSLPRIRESEKDGIAALTVEKAAWMFTAFLADVIKETTDKGYRYRFNKLGLGLGAKARGKDTILTAETGRKLGGNLGLFGGEILSKGYEVQSKAMLVFSGPTMALLDTPVWFRVGDSNRLVRYRYALLVDPATGRMDVILWRLGEGSDRAAGFDFAVILKPNTIDRPELVIDRKRISRLGIPSEAAFAVDRMPGGKPAPIPKSLRPLAGQTRFTADEAHSLDILLRKLVQ